MSVWIAMRSHNDMPYAARTVEALRTQTVPFRLLSMDNASTDGTAEVLGELAEKLAPVPAGQYVAGKVVNQGMVETDGEVVVYLNADCVPCHDTWLEELVAPFSDPAVAASFGRQVPRPGCYTLFEKDTEDTFGDGVRQARWRHCFSMASSAIRRSVWEKMPFDVTLNASEDIDWTWRARQAGHLVRYAPKSVVEHSHNYTLRQFYRRQFVEARAEALFFEWTPWESSFARYSLMPWARQLVADGRYCLARGRVRGLLHAPALRTTQLLARRRGLRTGLRERDA